jgi:methionyl-tRNA formyltransferase
MAHDVVFIGSSQLGLRCLLESNHFEVRGALCLAKRLTPALEALAHGQALPLKTFDSILSFRPLIESHPSSMPFFIYQLDMLVPADLTEKYAFYNVHRGNLMTNRGPNPDVWPILNGDPETQLSLHRINDKVDSGVLIDAVSVPVHPEDDSISVRQRLEAGLPRLVEALHEHLVGSRQGTVLEGGLYRPWITEADFTIDLARDSLDVIGRKIRSQRQYNGAILVVDGVKHYIVDILQARPRVPDQTFVCAGDGSTIRACSSSHVLILKRNEDPKYPPPPRQRPSKRV